MKPILRACLLACAGFSFGVGALRAKAASPTAADVPLPGTGALIAEWTFDKFSADEAFNYRKGWAGQGFGLTGTQRGAPEEIRVVPAPGPVPDGAPKKALEFWSHPRTDAWYAAHPEAKSHALYQGPDKEPQDDFFAYGKIWEVTDSPTVMMHVYRPAYARLDGIQEKKNAMLYTSLRMPLSSDHRSAGGAGDAHDWSGIWVHQSARGFTVTLRRPGDAYHYRRHRAVMYGDHRIPIPGGPLDPAKGHWLTLGLSITPDGDIHYFFVPAYVLKFTAGDCVGSAFAMNAKLHEPRLPVVGGSSAVVMSSNYSVEVSRTAIGDIRYTHAAKKERPPAPAR